VWINRAQIFLKLHHFLTSVERSEMSQMLENLGIALRDRSVSKSRVDPATLNEVLDDDFESRPNGVGLAQELEIRTLAENRFFGLGKLQPLIDDPSIEEIWINSPRNIFFARFGKSERATFELTGSEVANLVERMLRLTGRRLDKSSPFVDASLPDGSRVHVVIPDITRTHWSVNIRKFPSNVYTLENLTEMGSVSAGQLEFLTRAIQDRSNILVSGATQAGKTTVLCALLAAMDPSERLVSVEETFEIRSGLSDWVALQTRQPNLEGVGEVSLRRLIKEALRMRPSRLVVGEVREAEALDMLIALNSGLPGLCTIHANSAEDAILKLSTLPLLSGQNISAEFVQPTIAACIHYVVHCKLDENGRRSISEIRQLLPFDGQLKTVLVQC
jgi:pilus assembly protein CpaF